jgi:hypothetical protein
MHGTPKDAPLEYSQITDDLYIGAWPTKYNIDTIQSPGVTLVLSTILESVNKELGQPPLRLVKIRMKDALPNHPYYPTESLMRRATRPWRRLRMGKRGWFFANSAVIAV